MLLLSYGFPPSVLPHCLSHRFFPLLMTVPIITYHIPSCGTSSNADCQGKLSSELCYSQTSVVMMELIKSSRIHLRAAKEHSPPLQGLPDSCIATPESMQLSKLQQEYMLWSGCVYHCVYRHTKNTTSFTPHSEKPEKLLADTHKSWTLGAYASEPTACRMPGLLSLQAAIAQAGPAGCKELTHGSSLC